SSRRRHTRSKRDWSSDVCSSDLQADDVTLRTSKGPPCLLRSVPALPRPPVAPSWVSPVFSASADSPPAPPPVRPPGPGPAAPTEIGRASCRERVPCGAGDGHVGG